MPPFLASLRFRLRQDFRLSIVSMFGAIGVVAILPFSLLRFSQGNWVAGAVDFLVALGIMLPAVYAWRGGSLDLAGLWIAINNTAGSLAITALLGKTGLYWLFPALLSNFFIVRPGDRRRPGLGRHRRRAVPFGHLRFAGDSGPRY
ncbi:MAG: hypothetical protein KatS3mg128_0324 [Silanimonas sp.]|nr:MAG: hypothetical protein KatS3mg128_0324 [Silanimonas sp.]